MGDKKRAKTENTTNHTKQDLNDIGEEFIRSVNDFEKLARVGEGTYGVVCMSLSFYYSTSIQFLLTLLFTLLFTLFV
jgi:hypothetical protein